MDRTALPTSKCMKTLCVLQEVPLYPEHVQLDT